MIPLWMYLAVAAGLFCIGTYGVLSRRNAVAVLMSIELMLNAVNINLIAFWRYIEPSNMAGQAFAAFVFVIAAADISDDDRAWLFRRIDSYIVRRALCGLTPKNYNNTFVRLAGHLRSNGVSRESFISGFADSTGETVRFPPDDELRNAIQTRVQYGSLPTPRLRYILEELERASRDKYDETVGLRNDLTIEHVLPDKWAEHWPLPDGSRSPMDYIVTADDPRRPAITSRQVVKHTLGNLTLLTPAGNPRLGNLPFTTLDAAIGMSKREALRASLLKMNQEIAACEEWNESRIAARASRLADRAIARWPSI